MTTRRERLRAELIRDIKATALDHLRAHGPAGLSLRAIARDLDISAAGLYRYFEGRDDLLTGLIADGFDDLADHLLVATGAGGQELSGSDRPTPTPPQQVAADAPPGRRFAAAARAYRAWGVAHANEFALLFGLPIPGYDAPAGGATVAANTRVNVALLRPLIEAWLAGDLRVPGSYAVPDLAAPLAPLRDGIEAIAGVPVTVDVAGFALGVWARLHGVVSLEVFGQFAWLFDDDASALFEAELASCLSDLGLGDDDQPRATPRRPARP